jgi:hypothetical protein
LWPRNPCSRGCHETIREKERERQLGLGSRAGLVGARHLVAPPAGVHLSLRGNDHGVKVAARYALDRDLNINAYRAVSTHACTKRTTINNGQSRSQTFCFSRLWTSVGSLYLRSSPWPSLPVEPSPPALVRTQSISIRDGALLRTNNTATDRVYAHVYTAPASGRYNERREQCQ